ncbi:MAG: glyoxalase [Nitrospira sp.]|jgi:predicted enzyme related to lactoylglutathione lyase|nr:MAG: glyoxalase [Nitrospira sp.]
MSGEMINKGEPMGRQRKTKSSGKRTVAKASRSSSRVCWFEIPADDPERAKKFYGSLFGWTITLFPGTTDYWHIDTGGADETPDGGLMTRKRPQQPITNYVSVVSVTKAMAKVEKLGGTICKPKTAVPHMGYFAICRDTEGNEFALWEMNDRAKSLT